MYNTQPKKLHVHRDHCPNVTSVTPIELFKLFICWLRQFGSGVVRLTQVEHISFVFAGWGFLFTLFMFLNHLLLISFFPVSTDAI